MIPSGADLRKSAGGFWGGHAGLPDRIAAPTGKRAIRPERAGMIITGADLGEPAVWSGDNELIIGRIAPTGNCAIRLAPTGMIIPGAYLRKPAVWGRQRYLPIKIGAPTGQRAIAFHRAGMPVPRTDGWRCADLQDWLWRIFKRRAGGLSGPAG